MCFSNCNSLCLLNKVYTSQQHWTDDKVNSLGNWSTILNERKVVERSSEGEITHLHRRIPNQFSPFFSSLLALTFIFLPSTPLNPTIIIMAIIIHNDSIPLRLLLPRGKRRRRSSELIPTVTSRSSEYWLILFLTVNHQPNGKLAIPEGKRLICNGIPWEWIS